MTERILAEGAIEVGHHTTATWLGMTVNTDTVLATAIAAAITIGLAFFLKSKITSTGVPGGVQLFWEAITIQMRSQIEGAIGMKIAPFVLPLAVTLFVFILICNWIAVLPVQYGTADGGTHELLKPPASDINFVLALALFVFICYLGRCLAAGDHRPPDQGPQGACGVPRADQPRRGDRQAHLAVPATLRQHLRRRHHGRPHRTLPALHHVGAQCDLEDL